MDIRSNAHRSFGILLLSCLFLCQLTAQTLDKYARVRIKLDTDHTIEHLAALGIETDHGIYMPGSGFIGDLSDTELARVQAAGFQTKVAVADLQAEFLERLNTPISNERNGCNPNTPIVKYHTPANYTPGSYGGGYFRYQEMIQALDNMYQKFPNLITVRAPISDTIKTHQGRPIYWLKISDNPNQNENEPEVLYTALHHAREPNSLSQMLFYMWYLLENYNTDPEVKYIVDNTELYFIPCVNPDGYLYNELTQPNGGGMWRLNRRENYDGTYGVDLNRNYGYQWGHDDIGSSPVPGASTYRGQAPFSEPETRMIKLFCEQHDFRFALNYHTYGNLLIYPWAWSDELAEPALAEYAKLLTSENLYRTGTATETVGYQVNGSSDDYMYGAEGIFSMTPEVGPFAWGFWPNGAYIDGLNKDVMFLNLLMAQLPGRLAVPQETIITTSAGKAKLNFGLKRYGLEDGPFTVSVQPVSNNISAIVTPPQVVNLTPFQISNQNFDINLAPNIMPGDTVRVRILVHNGQFARTHEVAAPYVGQTVSVFQDQLSSLSGWQSSVADDWKLTTEHYYSAPTSCTDSPGGTYADNAFTTTQTKNPVHIPATAINATLRYYARWELENAFDYVTIDVGTPGNLLPQCATSTQTAAPASPTTPVYTGAHSNWSLECVDLSPFVGQSIKFGFTLNSDDFIARDGFYFDDVVVEYTLATGTVQVPVNQFGQILVQPNPAQSQALVQWSGVKSPARYLRLTDMQGREVLSQALETTASQQTQLRLQGLAAGTYALQLVFAEGETLSSTIQVTE